MSAYWLITPLVLLIGVGLLAWLGGHLDDALAELRDQLDRWDDVRTAVVRVRADTEVTRDSVDRLHRR